MIISFVFYSSDVAGAAVGASATGSEVLWNRRMRLDVSYLDGISENSGY